MSRVSFAADVNTNQRRDAYGEMSAPKPIKGVRVADDDLSEAIRALLMYLRNDLEPYGWSIHAEQFGKQLSFEFRNPLSPVSTGLMFDPSRSISDIRDELTERLSEEPEFAHTKKATPPRRKRDLIGGIRWAATSYGWSRRVFQEVIDTLRTLSVLSEDEWQWLKTVGPDVLRADLKREWRRRVKEYERRPMPDGSQRSKRKRPS
jgi:hypothetical protein